MNWNQSANTAMKFMMGFLKAKEQQRKERIEQAKLQILQAKFLQMREMNEFNKRIKEEDLARKMTESEARMNHLKANEQHVQWTEQFQQRKAAIAQAQRAQQLGLSSQRVRIAAANAASAREARAFTQKLKMVQLQGKTLFNQKASEIEQRIDNGEISWKEAKPLLNNLVNDLGVQNPGVDTRSMRLEIKAMDALRSPAIGDLRTETTGSGEKFLVSTDKQTGEELWRKPAGESPKKAEAWEKAFAQRSKQLDRELTQELQMMRHAEGIQINVGGAKDAAAVAIGKTKDAQQKLWGGSKRAALEKALPFSSFKGTKEEYDTLLNTYGGTDLFAAENEERAKKLYEGAKTQLSAWYAASGGSEGDKKSFLEKVNEYKNWIIKNHPGDYDITTSAIGDFLDDAGLEEMDDIDFEDGIDGLLEFSDEPDPDEQWYEDGEEE